METASFYPPLLTPPFRAISRISQIEVDPILGVPPLTTPPLLLPRPCPHRYNPFPHSAASPYVNEVPMPRNDFSSPPPSQAQASPNTSSSAIKAVVEKNGYVSFMLGQEILVDIAPNQAIRMTNKKQGVTLALSGCGTQMSLVHPQGRVLQYNSRIEMQGEDVISVKNAKMWPKGVSFTANNCALVYLVDKAGVRSTSDTFFDLTSNNTSDSMFLMSCSLSATNLAQAIYQSIENLREAEFWRTADGLNCWGINGVLIRQTSDGLTTVERQHGAEKFVLKTSPNNGKARLESSFLYVTASLGEEAHIFIKSEDRRLHYNGNSFQIRNGGHAAGFNESGSLRIW
ncbi:uncharacterized protein fest [Lepeophtheirus salmonis]|nr:uncharacterized protein LOC121115713 [Lepeophtheirus salmonis]